jgi:Mlc titration factor MtfA (ptsG expression regulator)
MDILLALAALVALLAGIPAGFRAVREARRRRIVAPPFPAEWEQTLQNDVALFRILPEELRKRLRDMARIFIAEKHFEGLAGFALTDAAKLVIASQACLLTLNRKAWDYPRLKTILVYPDSFYSPQTTVDGMLVTEELSERLGESWGRGVVVLAWDTVERESAHLGSSRNVVLHEFAHQLDQEDGDPDGTPILAGLAEYPDWARIFSREFVRLREEVRANRGGVLDPYGATDPAEFFAVATETFFKRSKQLKSAIPDLYALLGRYYGYDPYEWFKTEA